LHSSTAAAPTQGRKIRIVRMFCLRKSIDVDVTGYLLLVTRGGSARGSAHRE
jgi:hypothetical protein